MSGLDPPIRASLGKLVRLLGSDRNGEILGAAHALRRILNGAGLDMHDLARVIEEPPPTLAISFSEPPPWRLMLSVCGANRELLTARMQLHRFALALARRAYSKTIELVGLDLREGSGMTTITDAACAYHARGWKPIPRPPLRARQSS